MDSGRGLSLRIIAFVAFSAMCYFGAPVIITLVLAIILAYVLDPIVTFFARFRVPRSIGIMIAFLITALIFGGLIMLFVERTQDFAKNLPKYRSRIVKVQRDINQRIRVWQKRSEEIGSTIVPTTKNEPAPIQIKEYSTWGDLLFRELDPVYDSLLLIGFFPFLVYFLLLEKDEIEKLVSNTLRSQTRLAEQFVETTAEKLVNDVNQKIRGFVFGYLLSSLILFLVAWLIFFLFGVEQSIIWALLFAILNVLPFVGAFLGMIPPILIAVVQFGTFQKGITLILICIALHLIYANWLIPRTTGPRTQLTPLMSLMAMMYWGFLWGGIGILLAVPMTASLRSIWAQYSSLRVKDKIVGNQEEEQTGPVILTGPNEV
jgi:predicted PurR-regulated permease PerM